MPPKKSEPSKKSVDKQKQKIIEDKTFGLKNKKGSKQQKFVQQVQKQVQFGNKSSREIELAQLAKQSKKDEKKREMEELSVLFKPVAELQKVSKDVDPKSVLCIFFKQGTCKKGDKCRFSHDFAVERKAEKKSLYSDDIKESTMDGLNRNELEDLVSKKHGAANKGLPPTTIICKHFLDAVENSKYGWFWECPNGSLCHYRHAIPPDFILKKDRKKMDEQKESISLDELIENERMTLGMNLTMVNLQTFLVWKKRKREEKNYSVKAAKAKRHSDFTKGHLFGISGREMFEFNPEFIDEGDVEGNVCESSFPENQDGENDVPVHEIDLALFDPDMLETTNRLVDLGIDEDLFNGKELEDLR